jgi:hypothetical protein
LKRFAGIPELQSRRGERTWAESLSSWRNGC